MESVINLITVCKNKYDIRIKILPEYTVDLARNRLTEYFLSTDADYLFFVDSDIIVTESVLEKLIAADKPIVTGVYNKKSLTQRETTVCYIDEQKNWRVYKPEEIKEELFKCDACGFGCVLIKRDTMRFMSEKMKKICFRFIQQMHYISEDLYFCIECSKYNIEVWCDGTAKVAHVGKFFY
jgi:choline kinase